MKRIIALLLSGCLFLSSAAIVSASPISGRLVVENVEAELSEDTVKVHFSLEDAGPLTAIGIKDITYDEERFSLVSGVWTLPGTTKHQTDYEPFGDGEVATAVALYDISTDCNGDIFTLTLRVLDDAAIGKSEISCEFSAQNHQDTVVETVVGGSVTLHKFNQKITNEDTLKTSGGCTKDSVYYYSCECGAVGKKTFVVEAPGHKAGEWVVTKEPTCVATGKREKRCTGCDMVMKTEKIPIKHQHETMTLKTLSKKLYGYDDVLLTWEAVTDATNYKVYYRASTTSKFTYLGNTTGLSYKKANLSDGKKYVFKVVPYYTTDDYACAGKGKEVSITTMKPVGTAKNVKSKLYGYDDIHVYWSKSSNAYGYKVYYRKSTDSEYTYLGSTTRTYYKKANLEDGVKYYFKVVPYRTSEGYTDLGTEKSTSIYTLKKLDAPTVSKYSSSKVRVSWNNIDGESGYQISKATSKTKTSIVSTYSTTSGKTKTISAKRKATYYYKVRAYKTVSGKKIYGPWSDVTSFQLM